MANEPKNNTKPRRVVRWDNPAEMSPWFQLVRDKVADALAAGEDATRPFKERVLSRAEARRKLDEAEQSLLALLDAAEQGLPAAQEQEPDGTG